MYAAPLSNAACAVTGMILDDMVHRDWSPKAQEKYSHFRFGDALDVPCPIPVCLDSHHD